MTETEVLDCIPALARQIGRKFPGEAEVCEDILGETLLSAARLLGSGFKAKRASVGTILYRVAERRVADYLRAKYRGQAEIRLFDTPDVRDSGATTQERLEQRELAEAMGEVFLLLTERQRRALVWSALGLTWTEIAIVLGVGVRTVGMHKKIGRLKMSHQLVEAT